MAMLHRRSKRTADSATENSDAVAASAEDSQAADALTALVSVCMPLQALPPAGPSSRLRHRLAIATVLQPSTTPLNPVNPNAAANEVAGRLQVAGRLTSKHPYARMPRPQVVGVKRKLTQTRRNVEVDTDSAAAAIRLRAEGERRSKAGEDLRRLPAKKTKAQPPSISPPGKMRRPHVVSRDSEEEDDGDDEPVRKRDFMEQPWRGYDTDPREDREEVDGGRDDGLEASQWRRDKRESIAMKKPIEVDGDGQPFGSMKEAFANDVKKYAKDLDPRCGWDKQPRILKQNFFKRLYTDWQVCGGVDTVSEKFLGPIITKGLITLRFRINQLIDGNKPKPEDMKFEYWEDMVAGRATDVAQAKSAQMRKISKGKASSTLQIRAIEREVVSRLTMVLGRAPYDAEVDAEVAREYQRQQEEKRKVHPDHAQEIQEVRSRVAELESSLTRIEDNADASNKRMEAMMRQLLHGQGSKAAIASEENAEPASSTKEVGVEVMAATNVNATEREGVQSIGGSLSGAQEETEGRGEPSTCSRREAKAMKEGANAAGSIGPTAKATGHKG